MMMTGLRVVLVSSSLFFPVLGHGAEVEQAKAVIQRAISAQGGKAKLAKMQTFVGRASGVAFENGDKLPLTLEYWYQYPDQLKYILRVKLDSARTRIAIRVLNGHQAWEKLDGVTRKLEGKKLAELREMANHRRLFTLFPILEDKNYRLALLAEAKVDNHVAVGVKVTRKGYRDVSLYFDKATGLLVKMSRQTINPEGKTRLMEDIYERVQGLARCQVLLPDSDPGERGETL